MEGQLNIKRRADLIQTFAPIALFFIVGTCLYLMNWVDSDTIRKKAINNENLEIKNLELCQQSLSAVRQRILRTRPPRP